MNNIPTDQVVHLISHSMAHHPVRNYVIPGLTSALVAGEGKGKVRVFTNERAHREHITPHSHRFDFACCVLEGAVENIIYTETHLAGDGDPFCVGSLEWLKEFGRYEFRPGDQPTRFTQTSHRYVAGDWYRMSAHEVHSIYFNRGTTVVFFEGPESYANSIVLEPWANGGRVPTFETRPWMFQR